MLFALLIACGGKAAITLPLTPVPLTQQLLFVLLAGALLGSRLGGAAAMLYLLAAACFRPLWPAGAGLTPLTGTLAGYLWSLPLAAYLSGVFVERLSTERPAGCAIGVTAAVAVFDGLGSVRLMAAMQYDAAEAFVRGAGLFVGQHAAQAALTVLIASSASSMLHEREKK